MTTGTELLMQCQPTIGEVIEIEKQALRIALENMIEEYEHACKLAGINPIGTWAYNQAKGLVPNA